MVENQGTVIPGEGEGSSLSPQEQQKAKAVEKGWKPLEEYDGDPGDWVDAPEFLGRQKLYDRINDLKSTLTRSQREHQRDLKKIAEDMAHIREQEYTRALRELETKRNQAQREDDVDAVVAVSKEIEEVKSKKLKEDLTATKTPQDQGAQATPEFVEWQTRNDWFTKDHEMRSDAISIGTGYAFSNPNKTQVEVLDYVEKKIKKIYSEKFRKPTPPTEGKVEGSATAARNPDRKATGSGKKLTLDDLPAEEQRIARTIIKSGAFKAQAKKANMSEEEAYLTTYSANR